MLLLLKKLSSPLGHNAATKLIRDTFRFKAFERMFKIAAGSFKSLIAACSQVRTMNSAMQHHLLLRLLIYYARVSVP